MNHLNDKDLDFVARHYKEDALSPGQAWQAFTRRTGYKPARSSSRRWIAAASVTALFTTAIAGALWLSHQSNSPITTPTATTPASPAPTYRILQQKTGGIILRYNKEEIGNVLKELSTYYGKTLSTTEPERHISGEIEATSLEEVVEILESTLNIHISVQ